jgi:hypothetical protein
VTGIEPHPHITSADAASIWPQSSWKTIMERLRDGPFHHHIALLNVSCTWTGYEVIRPGGVPLEVGVGFQESGTDP